MSAPSPHHPEILKMEEVRNMVKVEGNQLNNVGSSFKKFLGYTCRQAGQNMGVMVLQKRGQKLSAPHERSSITKSIRSGV